MVEKLKKGETKRGIGPAGGAPVSEKTGKVFTGHKGTKRSIGPAGAPVSKTTGKVFTAKGSALFSGQSRGYPKTLDIRYEKDLKLQERQKKKRKFSNLKKDYNLRKPKMLD